MILGSKRISHGFQLFNYPTLIQKLIEQNVCLEVCPISNMMLGYINDLRHHPVRYMISKGLQVSINSGHPGIFGYNDVAFDYLAVFLAWDLNLRDLKKISLNGILHSSCDPETKK